MKKSITIILIFLTLSCGTKNINKKSIYIRDYKLYGELENGLPEKDTLIEFKTNKKNFNGIGKVAVSNNNVSDLKCGLWKEYDSNGILFSEGYYKISSYVDCAMSGPYWAYYYYRSGEWKYYKPNGEIDFILDFVPKIHNVDTRCEGGDKILFGIIENIPLKYTDKVNTDKVYELQKISFPRAYETKTTMIPLNGKIHYEIEIDF